MTEARSHHSSVKFRGGICRFKTFCMRIFARKTFLRFRCSSIHVKMRVLLTFHWKLSLNAVFRSAHAACAQRYHPLAAAPTSDTEKK